MKDRDSATIKADMLKVGVTRQAAEPASQGARRAGLADAAVCARTNHAATTLTPAQETALLTLVLPAYEKIVKDHVTVNLLQNEFDALVSFAFSPGGIEFVRKPMAATSDKWADHAKRHLKAELKRNVRGRYGQQGAFPAWFLFAVMRAIGAHTLRVEDWS
jgi:hypothetical protein